MKTIRKHPFLQSLILLVLLPAFVWLPTSVQSNPHGEIVIEGNVEFNHDGDTLRIIQESSKSIIHWDSYSIGSGESTIYEMLNSNSASLNRVTGSSASAIDGLLQANGHVWVINPNGIIVGPNGRIDASGAVLSTLDIDDNNFLHGGDFHFRGPSTASIINYGKIETADKGEIFVVAHDVQNHGFMGAPDGRVILAGGSDVLIEAGANGNVFVSGATAGGAHVLQGANATIEAAEVQLHARNGNPFGMAVQILGTVRARTAENVGGRVVLSAEGGANVDVAATGVVDASGLTGGSVRLNSDGGLNIGGAVRASGEHGAGSIEAFANTIEIQPMGSLKADGVIGGSVRIGSDGADGNVVADSVNLHAGSDVSANGSSVGGGVMVTATGDVLIGGSISAASTDGNGGSADIAANNVTLPVGGSVNVSGGNSGGTVGVAAANNVFVDGTINAAGGGATGGAVTIDSGNNLMISQTGSIDGTGPEGGSANLSAGDHLYVAGSVDVSGNDGSGGSVSLSGTDVTVAGTGVIRADGSDGGGSVNIAAGDSAQIFGQVTATGGDGQGGSIDLSGDDVLVAAGALIDAGGATGGTIGITAQDSVEIFGTVQAVGSDGAGGTIAVSGTDVLVGPTALVDAGGTSGGSITFDASNEMNVAGQVRAIGSDGSGGYIAITGDAINIAATASIDAGGSTDGGRAFIGGGFQGSGDLRRANSVTVAPGAQINAAGGSGNGGLVALWSDGSMDFGGSIDVGGAVNGGVAEVSGLETLAVSGLIDAGGGTGVNGTVLFDPVDVTIGASGITTAALIGALGTSNVIVHTAAVGIPDPGEAGNVLIEGGTELHYNSPNSLSIFAHGSITFDGDTANLRASVLNGGGGNINLVAGWDPSAVAATTTDIFVNGAAGAQTHDHEATTPLLPNGTGPNGQIQAADILAGTFGSFGGAGGNVSITNDDNDSTAAVGSFHGETNVFGQTLFMQAGPTGRRAVQIGVPRYVYSEVLNQDNVTGSLRGMVGNAEVYGAGDARNNANAGNINVHMTNAILMQSDNQSYTQIGHGASASHNWGGANYQPVNGNNHGDITVRAENAVLMQGDSDRIAQSQIGHGGMVMDWGGQPEVYSNLTGHIDVEAGSVTLRAGNRAAYAQIGHGGQRYRGEHWGNIDVNATNGSVSMTGGSGSTDRRRTWTQIGHGGFDTEHTNGRPADVPLGPRGAGTTVGEGPPLVDVINAQNAADGGNRNFSDITAALTDSATLTGVGLEGTRAYGVAGNINVTAAGGVNMRAGSDEDSWSAIGHVGRDSNLGLVGGWDIDNADGDNDWFTGKDGNITVQALNGGVVMDRFIEFSNNDGNRSFVQIGHGGYNSWGGAEGDILVEAHNGNIEGHAGQAGQTFAMIGHGGRHQSWGHGDTTDTDAFRHARARNDGFAAGNALGNITAHATGDVLFRSGFGNATQAFSQIGHGGYGVTALPHMGHGGNISVIGGGNVDFYAGRRNNTAHELGQDALLPGQIDRTRNGNFSDNWTAIGHQGRDHGRSNFFGNITVAAGENPFAGTASLGADIAPRSDGFVSVEATGGWDGLGFDDDVQGNPYPTFGDTRNGSENNSLTGDRNWAMIGHGGNDFEMLNVGDDRGRSGSQGIGVGALGYWYDDLTGYHVAGTIIGTLDDGSTGGSVAGDGIADVTAFHNAHDINGNDTLRPDQGGYADDNTRGRGWVIPNVGLAPRLLDPNNAADAALITTSNIVVRAAGDVRVVGPQFDPTNPMRNAYNATAALGSGLTGEGVAWDPDDLAALFNNTRTMTGRNNPTYTADVPLNLVQSARDSFAMIGHGGQNSGQRSFGQMAFNNNGPQSTLADGYGYYGDITVTAGGDIKVWAGDFIRELAPGESPDDVTGVTQYDFDGDGIGALPLYRVSNIIAADIGAANSSTSLNDVQQGSVGTDDLWAMIGHGGNEFSSHVRGNISVTSSGGGLSVRAGESVRSWGQVGHGGEAWNVGHESQINVAQDVQGTITVDVNGPVELLSGQTTFSFAQIGHGGVEFRDDDDPNTARGDGRNNFERDIFTVTNSDISVISRMGDITLRNRGAVDGAYIRPDYRDNFDGVNTSGDFLGLDIRFFRDYGRSHTVIGHGSYDGEVNVGTSVDDTLIGGNITVRAEAGNIQLGETTNLTGQSTAAPILRRSPIQIGHFMSFSDRTPPNTTLSLFGDIDLYAAGDITIRGSDSPRYILDVAEQRVHGARDGVNLFATPDADESYAFEEHFTLASAIGELYYPNQVNGGDFDSPAQVGHGGNRVGSWDGRATMQIAGDITVTADRAAVEDDPATVADETAEAAKIVLDAGDGTGSYAMIGHGGRRARHAGPINGDVVVTASGDIVMLGGERFQNGLIGAANLRTANFSNWATIGHNIQTTNERSGDANGDVTVYAGRDLTMQAGFGEGAHVRIGNGSNFNYLSQDHQGNFTGNIDVKVGRDLTIRGGDLNNDGSRFGFSAQENWLGIGGTGEDALNGGELGDPTVGAEAEGAGVPHDTYAQIGHGGNGVSGVMQGNITIDVGNDFLLTRGEEEIYLDAAAGPYIEQAASGGNAKVGHGDWLNGTGRLTREGSIQIGVGNDFSVHGSQVGHVDQRVSSAIAVEGATTVSTGRAGTGGTLSITSAISRTGLTDPVGLMPDPGTLADNGFGVSSFSSAIGGDLRFYVPEHNPTTDHINVAAGTLFNGSSYIPHAPEPIGGPYRADETEQIEVGFTFTNPLRDGSATTGGTYENDLPDWAPTPLGPYPAHGFGDYHFYFGNVPVVVGPGVGGPVVGGGGGDGDLLPTREEEDLLSIIVPEVTTIIEEPIVALPQIGLTPLQLSLIDGFNTSGVQFEIGRGLQTDEEGGTGEVSSPVTTEAVLFFQSGNRVFAVTGQGTFYVTSEGDPYDLLPAGTLKVEDVDALTRRRTIGGQSQDGSDGTIDMPVDDTTPNPSTDPAFDPFRMDSSDDDDDDDDEEEDGGLFNMDDTPAVNTGDTTTEPEGEFDF